MQKLAVVLSCGIFSVLLCVPSFAVSDSDPLDSSYEIQDDVSVLSVPPVELLADTGTTYRVVGDYSNLGHYITKANVSGMTDTNLQYAINYNADANAREIYRLENYIAERASSGLTQGQLDSSLGDFWSIFDVPYLYQDGTIKQTTNAETLTPKDWLRNGFMGLAAKLSLGFPDPFSIYHGSSDVVNNQWSYLTAKGYYRKAVNGDKFVSLPISFYNAFNIILNSVSSDVLNRYTLQANGALVPVTGHLSLFDMSLNGFSGLSSIMRGNSGSSVSGVLLDYSDLSSTSYSSNNILGAFKPLFDIQNDVARLTHVIADPTEQALHDATKDNVQAVTDNLTGDNGVSSQDIGDLSGISSGVGDFMTTGVSPDRLTVSISDEGNYSFFSQQTADDLHTFPAPLSADDNFVDFYALNRQKYSSLLGGDSDG